MTRNRTSKLQHWILEELRQAGTNGLGLTTEELAKRNVVKIIKKEKLQFEGHWNLKSFAQHRQGTIRRACNRLKERGIIFETKYTNAPVFVLPRGTKAQLEETKSRINWLQLDLTSISKEYKRITEKINDFERLEVLLNSPTADKPKTLLPRFTANKTKSMTTGLPAIKAKAVLG